MRNSLIIGIIVAWLMVIWPLFHHQSKRVSFWLLLG